MVALCLSQEPHYFSGGSSQNAYLKELADICGINKVITTHTARKSYASVLYQKGVSIGVIAKMLGHTSEKTTQRTYAFLTEDNVLNEAAKILK